MKYATARPYADPEKAARRIREIANAVEPIQGRIAAALRQPQIVRDENTALGRSTLQLVRRVGVVRTTTVEPSTKTIKAS